MTEPADAFRFVDEAAARATGTTPPASPEPPSREAFHVHLEAARAHRSVGSELPPDVRLRRLKQLMVKTSAPVVSYQREFNDQVLAALQSLMAVIDQRSVAIEAMVTTAEITGEDVTSRLDELSPRLDALVEENESLRTEIASLRSEVAVQRAHLDALARSARAALPGGFDESALATLARRLDESHQALYRDFENVFRGTREQVRAMAVEHVPDLKEVAYLGPVLDIGCGRGEWLELLGEAGIEAYGVDANAAFVEANLARGLDVRQGDALVHLQGVPEASLGAVTAFHLVEHLPLDTLVALADAALIALKPGGLLLLETPNPTNLRVGAASFYLDPTHLKPVHPKFLEFLLADRGFAEVEVRYVHQLDGVGVRPEDLGGLDAERASKVAAELDWALFGPLDYVAIAHKAEAA